LLYVSLTSAVFCVAIVASSPAAIAEAFAALAEAAREAGLMF